jgi:hypothetical protein
MKFLINLLVFFTFVISLATSMSVTKWHNESIKQQASELQQKQDDTLKQQMLVTLEAARQCYRQTGKFPKTDEIWLLESYIPLGTAGFKGRSGFSDPYTDSGICLPIESLTSDNQTSLGQVRYQGLNGQDATVVGTNNNGFTYNYNCSERDMNPSKTAK